MREACMESCGRCQDKGCVDNFESCPTWTLKGYCDEAPKFMLFNCRESCGTCGFKSRFDTELQIVNGKQYTDITADDFTCGEDRKLTTEQIAAPKTESTDAGEIGLCSYTVISDRFALTAEHCIIGVNRKDQYRRVSIRDNTQYQETIGVSRVWTHPARAEGAYYDIAIMELERRIIFDYDKYGNSPNCLGKDKYIKNQIALQQGAGLTEKDELGGLQDVKVKIIQNEECYAKIESAPPRIIKTFKQELPEGINEGMLCTLGIENEDGVIQGPCQGDSGAPLFTKDINENGDLVNVTLVGVHSGAASCGSRRKKDLPAWWVRVATFYDWITCIKEKAAQGKTHQNTERGCFRQIRRSFVSPACSHTKLLDTDKC